MRIIGWRAAEVAQKITEQAITNAKRVMDDVVAEAKRRCPEGHITRDGTWVTRTIAFNPKTGRNKGKPVKFQGQQWTGREPGSLRDTIRRVDGRRGRRGNIRVYAGTRKINYAHFVERGTSKMTAKPFLRPTFHALKPEIPRRIKEG